MTGQAREDSFLERSLFSSFELLWETVIISQSVRLLAPFEGVDQMQIEEILC